MNTQKWSRGFTLIELLLVLSILTLVQAWVVPALAEMVDSARVNSAAQALSESLMRARSEAIKRNSRVVVCKSSTGASCEAQAGWEQGWIIFHDDNNNAALDADESVLYREVALGSSLRLSGNTPVRDYVSYTPYGRTKMSSGAFQAGTFTVCTKRAKAEFARQVVISAGGRARVAKAAASKCDPG
jgi:type IV fimbrial biogenesis protein FimT